MLVIILDPIVPVKPPELSYIYQRIKEVMEVLGDFKNRRQQDRYVGPELMIIQRRLCCFVCLFFLNTGILPFRHSLIH